MNKFKVGNRVTITDGHGTGRSGVIKQVSGVTTSLPEYHVLLDGMSATAVYFENAMMHEDILDQEISESDDSVNYYWEMATIATDEKLNINVNPEADHLSIAYFKVLNAESFRKATKVARLHFKDSGMEHHNDGLGKQPWILNSKELKHIIELLKEPNDSHDGYTNWQIACYQWNLENGLIKKFKDYFDGVYDHMYDNDSRLKEAYVPSTQEMPETWEYESK